MAIEVDVAATNKVTKSHNEPIDMLGAIDADKSITVHVMSNMSTKLGHIVSDVRIGINNNVVRMAIIGDIGPMADPKCGNISLMVC